jgi:hypothetical protein
MECEARLRGRERMNFSKTIQSVIETAQARELERFLLP